MTRDGENVLLVTIGIFLFIAILSPFPMNALIAGLCYGALKIAEGES